MAEVKAEEAQKEEAVPTHQLREQRERPGAGEGEAARPGESHTNLLKRKKKQIRVTMIALILS